jgi:hypothetical protein
MNKDMATLSLNANGMVAAMKDSKMIFNGEGLTVKNGSFKIVKNGDNSEEDSLLYAGEDGNLWIKGSGTFNGDIYANNGYFHGKIEADEGYFHGIIEAEGGYFRGDISAANGTIGGFKID